ncbi:MULTISPECIES: rhodanese-like domain-containing protein [unclassified Acidovorax]|uniref:sulfurtransferase n=1 Tax=unclassified Acidovorax TaxID=2684926 RepID=UPI0028831645|nr:MULTISPECIES: rhodanese-like domain-containing protein [unclassified Acidovorax]
MDSALGPRPAHGLLVGGLAFAGVAFASNTAATSALVTTDWLAQNLANSKVRVIEVSVNPGLYERSHVPGAVNFSWHNDLNDKVRRDIVSKEAFESLLSKDNRAPEFAATTYRVGAVNNQLRARLSDALAATEGRSDAKLVDIRSADEYSGKVFAPSGLSELSIRAGHIPGAANVPWGQDVKEDGTFKSADDLKRLYAAVGIDGSKPVITYCRIGERSSHTWFALSKILSYNVKNYDGSWTDYGNSVGGVVLGWGAMTGLGCTIGTMLSGGMVGALSGWVFGASMFAPVGAGLWLIRRGAAIR